MTAWHLPRRSTDALARYEERSGTAMFVVSLLYLSLVFVEMLPGERPGWDITVVDGVFWGIITIDYVWRVFLLAPHPWRYARRPRCLLDLTVIACSPVMFALIFSTAPAAAAVDNVLRFVRAGAQAGRTILQARRVYSRRSISWVIPVAVVITVFLSIWIWRYEASHAGTSIRTWNDALWYAMATLMTVGYGDIVPVTAQGRIAGVLLMIVGIGLLSWITATLASIFVETQDEPVDEALYAKLDELAERLARIEARLPGPAPGERGGAEDAGAEAAEVPDAEADTAAAVPARTSAAEAGER